MADGEPTAAEALHVVERKTRYALGAALGDDLDGFGRALVDHAFDADVEVFAVLPEDDDVHFLAA